MGKEGGVYDARKCVQELQAASDPPKAVWLVDKSVTDSHEHQFPQFYLLIFNIYFELPIQR